MSRKQMWKCKQVKTACPFRNVLCVCVFVLLCECVCACMCGRVCVCEAVILGCVKTTCRSVSALTLDPCPPCVSTRQLGVCVGTWPSTSLAALTWTRSAPAVSVGGQCLCLFTFQVYPCTFCSFIHPLPWRGDWTVVRHNQAPFLSPPPTWSDTTRPHSSPFSAPPPPTWSDTTRPHSSPLSGPPPPMHVYSLCLQ